MSFKSTPVEEIPSLRDALYKGFATGKTKSIQYRKQQLAQLAYLIHDNKARFRDALATDLRRHTLESDFLEITGTVSEVMEQYNNVEKWSKAEKADFSLNWFAMNPTIRKEPKGVVLIIGPFNFPMWCLLPPLAAAIAAGNAAMIKPSELSSATADLIAELIPQYMDPDIVRVVVGGVPQVTKLIEFPWDHIMYTGSQRVAKIIAAAAAKHLTPTTMELGGKSPVIVDSSADLKVAARRIMWGKTANAGQICVAPDYILVVKDVEHDLVKELQEIYRQYFGPDPAKSDSLSRIITSNHAARIKKLVDETRGNIVAGGEINVDEKYVSPTIVKDVPKDDSLMSEEIFGPVLPIIAVNNIDEAIEYVNTKEHPLVLYVFTKDRKVKEKIFDNTRSGAAIANDVVIHPAAAGLPFGGIGASGSGYTTGKFAFNTFTHLRASLDNPAWVDSVALGPRFPPYTDDKMKALSKVMSYKLPPRVVTNAKKPR
ncbi:NAD-aldehyde dehydrogenase [Panus rudis PR-1116 ss-1]|nr:NAD-aldehyde dehydrogenase [Panus rudis PR-1116 ss-1]